MDDVHGSRSVAVGIAMTNIVILALIISKGLDVVSDQALMRHIKYDASN
jgi:hypothetical protein